MKPDIRYLILWLTTRCNLNCRYCYRGIEESEVSLDFEIARKALDMAAGSGKSFQRLISLCQRYNISIGVSLDGPFDIQEKLRGRAKDTFVGLKRLEGSNLDFRVTTVVTDINVMELWRMALLLADFQSAKGIGLDLLVSKGKARDASIKPPSVDSLIAGLTELMNALKFINKRRVPPLQLREQELLKAIVVKRNRDHVYCHACKGESLAVHPDGSLYPCGQTIGDPNFFLGTIDHPDWVRLKALSSYRLEGLDCVNCPIREYCPGDCPSRQYYNNREDRSLVCVMYQTISGYVDMLR